MSEEISQDMIDKIAQKGRESLFFLTRAILGFDKMTKEIHRPICKVLEDFENNTRILTVLPRDWYKTTLVSISYPIWRAIRNPEVRILLVQNTFTNATSKLAAIKQIFEKNALFRACYPELLPGPRNKWKGESLCVNRKGTYPESTFEGAGTSTQTTSRHYDVIIEDDTVAPDYDSMSGILQEPTQAEIEKAIGWHRLAIPLLIEPAESQIIVVGTRWAEADLIQYILDNESSYNVVTRSCLENENGEPDVDGEPTWPETDDGRPKFNREVLDQIFDALGPYMASALYLNLPVNPENQLFKKNWINYYRTLPDGLLYCTSIDPASADVESSSDPDYSVILSTGINPKNGHIYVMPYDRDRMNPGEQIRAIFSHNSLYKPLEVKVEAIAYQRTLSYWLKRQQNKLGQFFVIDEIRNHKASKEGRIKGLQPYFKATRIFIRSDMPELERELLAFPRGKHDDIIDALSMHLGFWITYMSHHHEVTYERTYEANSASKIIDLIAERRRKLMSYPNDLGILGDRVSTRYRKRVRF